MDLGAAAAPRRGEHVLYLTPGCFDKGGVSRYSRYQIQALRDLFGAGNVHALSLLGPDASSLEGNLRVTFAAGGVSAWHKAQFIRQALSIAAQHRPKLVYSAHANLSAVCWAAARATGATSVVNVYGGEVWSPQDRDVRFGLRHVDHLVADCHFTARYVERVGTRKGRPTEVIWDCVDLRRFSPARPSAAVLATYGIADPAQHVNVVTLGRLRATTIYKGYFRLLQAFGRVAHLVPDLRLVYAGGGDLVPEMRRLIEREGLSDRAVVTGPVHEDHLPDVYRAASVFSMVGNREQNGGEGIPLTPLEAAACGAPVLVGDRDGSPEAVVHGETGYALNPYDIESLAQTLLELARAPELRAKLGAAGRRFMEKNFSYETFRAKHAALAPAWLTRP